MQIDLSLKNAELYAGCAIEGGGAIEPDDARGGRRQYRRAKH